MNDYENANEGLKVYVGIERRTWSEDMCGSDCMRTERREEGIIKD